MFRGDSHSLYKSTDGKPITWIHRIPVILLSIFLISTLGITAAGWFFYEYEKKQVEHEAQYVLAAIADMKINQIYNWRQERLGDASVISRDPSNRFRLRQFLEKASPGDKGNDIKAWMESFQSGYNYKDVVLLDTQGRIWLSVGFSETDIDALDRTNIAAVVRSKKPMLSDFHRSVTTGRIHLGLYAPLLVVKDASTTPVCMGVMLLEVDPNFFLYPLIQSWPIPSPTGETLLVERDGEEVLFLNELRHRKNTALNLRFPLTNQNLPSAMVVRRQEGMVKGIDYRGIQVLSALRQVPESPWFMVAKQDIKEVTALLRFRAWVILLFAVGTILVLGMTILLWWKRREAGFYRRQYQLEQERSRAEENLLIMSERLNLATRAANIGIWDLDILNNKLVWDNTMYRLYGITPDYFAGAYEAWETSLHPDDLIRGREEIQMAIRGEKEFDTEFRVVWLDRSIHYIKANGLVLRDASGRAVRMLGTNWDITERKRTEEKLKESEEKFRNLFHHASDAIFVHKMREDGTTGNFIEVNDIACKRLGYSREELLSLSIKDIDASEELHRVLEDIRIFLSQGSHTFERTHVCKNGQRIPVEINAHLIEMKGRKYALSIARDITERKKAEAELRKLSQAVEQSASTIVITDVEGRIEYVNPKFTEVSGYLPLDVIGKSPGMLKSGLTPPEVYKELWIKITSGKEWKGELYNKKKNGEFFWEFESISPIINQEGKITHFIAVKEDITERKKIEEELNRLKTAIDQSYNSIVITDTQGNIQYTNPAFERITGYLKQEAIGLTPRVLKSGKQSGEFYRTLWETVLKGEIWHGDIINKKKNGELYYEEMTITPVKDIDNKIINLIAIKRDITQRIELENNLQRLRRENEAFMRHEIKNLISPIKGYSELLLYKFSDSMNDKQKGFLTAIKESIDKVVWLIDYLKKLQDFELGKIELEKKLCDLKSIIDGVLFDLSMMAEQNNAVILFDNKALDSKMKLDINLIPGVFNNLIKNAIEHVRNLTGESEKVVKIEMYNKDDKIIIKINNKGEPVPPDKIELFFEKFNSDRDKKKEGTGLGTTYAYLVTKAHGGDIAVESNEEKGTTVTLSFNVG